MKIDEWPEDELASLGEAMNWALLRAVGGDELDPLELHLRYEQVARKSLGVALILTQRDSAVGIIAASGKETLLREIADGAFVTVGIAQLTTSRQGATPSVVAVKTDSGYRASGMIPWATGAAKAKYVVCGAATDQGQILFALRPGQAGVNVEPPLGLVALAETWTSTIRCADVRIDDEMVLQGPIANVLSSRRKSVPIPQAFLALGHCRGAMDLILKHDSDRARMLVDRFGGQIDSLHEKVIAVCQPGADTSTVPVLRGECNELALRITHAAVALYKGTALLLSHPAQRLAREAMFLLVWSCPDPVIDCTVELLSGDSNR